MLPGSPASTSANGVPVYRRLPATSSVTVKLAGALTVGASLTAVIRIVLVPTAACGPPLPWEPPPSLKIQSICTLAGGASLALA